MGAGGRICTFVTIVLFPAGALCGASVACGGGITAAAGVHCLLGHSLELVHFLGGGSSGVD